MRYQEFTHSSKELSDRTMRHNVAEPEQFGTKIN